MEFTKEQLEYLKNKYRDSHIINVSAFFNSFLKPETKRIVVEIEYGGTKFKSITAFKVKELPEVFSREDMINFANYNSDYPEFLTMNNLSRFLSERNK